MQIAARTGAWSGGKWVNPYITDGLIAMWDGEWNAGGGVQDTSLDCWVDIVGGIGDISFYAEPGDNPEYEWTPKCLRAYPKFWGSTISNWFFSSSGACEEVVFRKINHNLGADAVLQVSPWVGINLEHSSIRYTFGSDFDYNNSQYFGVPTSYVLNASGNIGTFYRNGNVLGSKPSNFTRNGKLFVTHRPGVGSAYSEHKTGYLDIYCIRIYNRGLTDSELAANYAIDKARFNLT